MYRNQPHIRHEHSYRHNAQGKDDIMVTEHPLYTEMGRTKAMGCEYYKSLFKMHIDDDQLKSICAAWQTGTPLGNDHFREKLSGN